MKGSRSQKQLGSADQTKQIALINSRNNSIIHDSGGDVEEDGEQNNVSDYLDKLNDEVQSLREEQGVEELGNGVTLDEANSDIRIIQNKIDKMQQKFKISV